VVVEPLVLGPASQQIKPDLSTCSSRRRHSLKNFALARVCGGTSCAHSRGGRAIARHVSRISAAHSNFSIQAFVLRKNQSPNFYWLCSVLANLEPYSFLPARCWGPATARAALCDCAVGRRVRWRGRATRPPQSTSRVARPHVSGSRGAAAACGAGDESSACRPWGRAHRHPRLTKARQPTSRSPCSPLLRAGLTLRPRTPAGLLPRTR